MPSSVSTEKDTEAGDYAASVSGIMMHPNPGFRQLILDTSVMVMLMMTLVTIIVVEPIVLGFMSAWESDTI